MKIIYCVPSLCHLGGLERIVCHKMNLLVKRGHEVSVITTDQNGRPCYFDLNNSVKCYDLGINYEANRKRSLVKKAFYFFYNRYQHKKRLEKLLQSLRADIVISTFFNEMSILPLIKDGSKKILEFHFNKQMFKYIRRTGLQGWLDDISYKRLDRHVRKFSRFVVLTQEDADNWTKLNNMVVIPNICSLKFGCRASLTNHRVMTVGRYEYQKGFERLIDAWSLIARDVDDWTLHIVGEGSLRPDLTEQIRKKGLEHSIFLDGATKDMVSEYLNSSIAVFTSRYEGFLLAIIEAESAGVPVVSFETPCGPKDIIRNGEDGFLIFNEDIHLLAEKIRLLIQKEDLRMCMGKKAYINSQKYTEKEIITQWISLFEQVIKE